MCETKMFKHVAFSIIKEALKPLAWLRMLCWPPVSLGGKLPHGMAANSLKRAAGWMDGEKWGCWWWWWWWRRRRRRRQRSDVYTNLELPNMLSRSTKCFIVRYPLAKPHFPKNSRALVLFYYVFPPFCVISNHRYTHWPQGTMEAKSISRNAPLACDVSNF